MEVRFVEHVKTPDETGKGDYNSPSNRRFAIGLYELDGTLIGYKADTFWTLTTDKEDAKPHLLDDSGGIPAHILKNLWHVANRELGYLEPLSVRGRTIFVDNPSFLVGYENFECPGTVYLKRFDSGLPATSSFSDLQGVCDA